MIIREVNVPINEGCVGYPLTINCFNDLFLDGIKNSSWSIIPKYL